jgi:hypothetical protein
MAPGTSCVNDFAICDLHDARTSMRSPFRCDSLRLSGKKSFEVYRPRDRTVSFTLGDEYEDVGALNQRPMRAAEAVPQAPLCPSSPRAANSNQRASAIG